MDFLTHFSILRTLYKGNSIQHWHGKANAYGNAIMELWKLPELEKYSDGKTSIIEAVKKAVKESK